MKQVDTIYSAINIESVTSVHEFRLRCDSKPKFLYE
ncbi:hypothetical protein P879_11802 [Paragonimus westermani]|uniref:Uncharacterized protein n=1 Tax=Paragonimus westermani TaxID=34504 RepID=A0A8T0D7V1_9TREM|nr:hypothetical protein P879_11802 [Paragonimus westermani]